MSPFPRDKLIRHYTSVVSRALARTQNRDAGYCGERASPRGAKIHTASHRSLLISARFSLQYGGANTGSVWSRGRP